MGGQTDKPWCELRAIYPQWHGHASFGPNLLVENDEVIANQLLYMNTRGFVDCLVVEFAFRADPAPEVQSIPEHQFSSDPWLQKLHPQLGSAAAATASSSRLLQGLQGGPGRLSMTTSSSVMHTTVVNRDDDDP